MVADLQRVASKRMRWRGTRDHFEQRHSLGV